MRRSVLTEKIARRGLHLTREYSVDPLEALLVEEVMSRDLTAFDSETLLRSPLTVHPQDTLREVAQRFAQHSLGSAAVVEREQPDRLLGLVTVENLLQARLRDIHEEHRRERVLRAPPTSIGDTSAV
jgi:CBS domain-containing protein